MSYEELQQMDKEELLGIIKAQRFEISILKDDKEHLGEFLKEKEDEIERLQEDIGSYVNIVLYERKEIDRLNNQIKEYGDLDNHNKSLYEENKRLNNIINDIDTYIHLWKLDDIGEKTMLILNDILLIKNGMRNEVVRLGSDKE